MPKIYIKINPKLKDEWIKLSRNQILIILVSLYGDKITAINFKKEYYKKLNYRFNEDNKCIENYSNLINEMVEYDNDLKLSYDKMKISTLKLILEKKLNKRELLIIMYLIHLYQNQFIREHTINISQVLKEIFKCNNNIDVYKKIFINTLEKLKSWKYKDGSTFIKDFIISSKSLTLFLDSSPKSFS